MKPVAVAQAHACGVALVGLLIRGSATRLELEHVPMMCIPKFGSWLLFADVSSITRQIGRRSLSKPLLDPYQRQLQWGWPL
jgi:hypothetical protein